MDVAAGHLVHQGDEHACAAGADGVTDGDRSAVDVDLLRRDAQLAGDRRGDDGRPLAGQ